MISRSIMERSVPDPSAVGILDGGIAIDPANPPPRVVAILPGGGCAVIGWVLLEGTWPSSTKTVRPTASNDDRSRARQFDQFYTRPDLAAHYLSVLATYLDFASVLMVEPSAGDGAFFILLPVGSLGFDVEPKRAGIQAKNFLTVTIGGDRPICFVGNPPFGTASNLAIAFFNHCAREASVIAMILPATFRKGGIQNRLHPNFHLIHDESVPEKAFRFGNRLITVPTAFMIWERRPDERDRWPTSTRHPDFEFLPFRRGAHFMIQRIGSDAGLIHERFGMSPNSHYFVRSKRRGVKAVMRQLNLAATAANTAGCPSIGMAEIVALYEAYTGRRSGV